MGCYGVKQIGVQIGSLSSRMPVRLVPEAVLRDTGMVRIRSSKVLLENSIGYSSRFSRVMRVRQPRTT